MASSAIPGVREALSRVTIGEARAAASAAMALADPAEARQAARRLSYF
jgi:phosphoenolpyruvate-protein kinase (PTS system EI component)